MFKYPACEGEFNSISAFCWSAALFCRHPVVGIDTEYQSLCQDLGLPEGERKRAWDSDSSHFMLSSALFCRHPVVGIDTEYQSLCQDLGLPKGERKRAWDSDSSHFICFVL